MAPDVLILLDARGRRHRVPLRAGPAKVGGLGVVDPSRIRDRVGRKVTIGGRSFLVLEPSLRDLLETLDRGAQTIGPKDLGAVLLNADIGPGARVVEGGSGSGSLCIALARAVGTSGHVVSVDLRAEALDRARRNAADAGIAAVVEFRQADLRQDLGDREVDAVILDIPDPWAAVPAAWEALRPCGQLAAFSPNMEQVKETVAALGKRPFVDVRTIELIEREMEVREVGVRPSFAPLGQTGYQSFARKVLETL